MISFNNVKWHHPCQTVIPFEQFKRVTKLTEGGFSSIYTATWTRGSINDYDENEKEFSYSEEQLVVLKSLNDSNNPGKGFFDEVGSYCLKQYYNI